MQFAADLNSQGWSEVTITASCEKAFERELLSLSMQLGVPVASRTRGDLVEKLTPISRERAKPRSLSKKFGLDSFPLHTDCAHWTKPPRFLILASRANDSSGTLTILLDTRGLKYLAGEKQDVLEGLFLASNGRHSFFCSIQDVENSCTRFDPGCMRPRNDSAVRAMRAYTANRHIDRLYEVYWSAGQVMIIDNWRVLHGRTSIVPSTNNRELWRVLVQ